MSLLLLGSMGMGYVRNRVREIVRIAVDAVKRRMPYSSGQWTILSEGEGEAFLIEPAILTGSFLQPLLYASPAKGYYSVFQGCCSVSSYPVYY